jgi:uncharacterized protein (TIGR04255 family)
VSGVDLPRFQSPPVTETVLSAQFDPLVDFTTAHAGWFWREQLGAEWADAEVREAPRLEDFKESFGVARFIDPGIAFRLGLEPNRIQVVRHDRMIQVQNSRFAYNWIRDAASAGYPSYGELLPEFRRHWAAFLKFVEEAGLGQVQPNQWEVTYVNQFPRGEHWETPHDWRKLVRDLALPASNVEGQQLDGLRAEWQYVLGDEVGRLRILLQQGRLEEGRGAEVLTLKLIARGPVSADRDLFAGFKAGHEAIVRSFAAMTTDAAHRDWGRLR